MYPFIDWTIINWTSLIIATLAAYGLGALWYSQLLFGKMWIAGNSLKSSGMDKGPEMYKLMGLSLIVTLIMSFVLTQFIGMGAGAQMGMRAGLLAGIGFSSTGILLNGIYLKKSTNVLAIDCTYLIASLTIMGTILGYWS